MRAISFITATCLTTIGVGMSPVRAAILEVGSGQTYTNIQAAWNAASSGDTIQIHAGVYSPTGGAQYALLNRASSSDTGKNNITIEAAGDGRVTVNSGFAFFGTTDGKTGDITVEGLYFNTSDSHSNKIGMYLRADAGQTLLGMTVRDNVFYGDFAQAIYTYGPGTQGEHLIEHNTVYGSGSGTTFGIRDLATRGGISGSTAPIIRDNIVINTITGYYSGSTDLTFDYSDGYDNTTNFSSTSRKGSTSVEVDPLFASTNPADPHFLYLSANSPASVTQGAHDGTYMGALSVVPEPSCLGLFGIAAAGLLPRLRRRSRSS
jgi:hypothetical protein